MSDQAAPDTFREWMANLATLEASGNMFGWDRDTAMAAGSADGRAKVMASLATLVHRELSRPDIPDVLDAVEERSDDPLAGRMVEEARRRVYRAERVPAALERELADACLRGITEWARARPSNDFAAFAPRLERIVRLKREEAALLEIGDEPYDALLDEFEPGARVRDLAPLITDLRDRLGGLLTEIDPGPPPPLAQASWDVDGQLALSRRALVALGYDLDHGATGLSAHPFSVLIHAGDVRVTTRVSESSPLDSLMSSLHECGHALYDQGLPPELGETLIGGAASLGAHESQSRFYENHVGRDPAFWEWLAPHLRDLLPDGCAKVDPMTLHRAATTVSPSLVRTEADEVTYNLHIVLRFELELALLRDELDVGDLPAAWSDGMERLLGIRPPSDVDGVLQDMHWADGDIGYFPTYTLGNLYAAQLTEALEAEHGALSEMIRREAFGEILGFMREHVHRCAFTRRTPEIMAAATGVPLGADALLRHLRARYLHDR